jgi:hypothetical protein
LAPSNQYQTASGQRLHAHTHTRCDRPLIGRIDQFTLSSKLRSEQFLELELKYLQPAGVDLNDPGKLAEPEHLSVGQVADADLAKEGDEMVLAEGEHLNVLHHDELVSVFLEDGVLHRVLDRVLVALNKKRTLCMHVKRLLICAAFWYLGEECKRLCRPHGCVNETLPVGIFAGGRDNRFVTIGHHTVQ